MFTLCLTRSQTQPFVFTASLHSVFLCSCLPVFTANNGWVVFVFGVFDSPKVPWLAVITSACRLPVQINSMERVSEQCLPLCETVQ